MSARRIRPSSIAIGTSHSIFMRLTLERPEAYTRSLAEETLMSAVLRNVLFILFVSAAIPAAAQSSLIYVTNSAGDSIHVIDPATQKVMQEIKGIEGAHGIDFSPDGSRVYVSNEVDGTLDVIDRKSRRTLAKVKLSGHPNNIATTKDGGRVIVGIRQDPGALDIVDTASLKLAKSIPVKGGLHNVYVTPDNKFA